MGVCSLRCVSVVVLLLSCGVAYYVNNLFPSPEPCNRGVDHPCRFFSDSGYDGYLEARSRFMRAARNRGGQLYQLEVSDGYWQDVAVFQGDPSRLLFHISGTHGSEGHAGSAIQLAVLADRSIALGGGGMPTVVMLHLNNPWGYANQRRWTENNIDLNRNLLSEKTFAKKIAEDPNENGYKSIIAIIYDQLDAVSCAGIWGDLSVIGRLFPSLLSVGKLGIKRAMVSATYKKEYKDMVFYGGQQLEQNHINIINFFKKQGYFDSMKKVVQIDVHTGLGPRGKDTLLFKSDAKVPIQDIFQYTHGKQFLQGVGDGGGDVSQGYEAMVGHMGGYCNEPSAGFEKVYGDQVEEFSCFTQEFGTKPGILVATAMLKESICWNQRNDNDIFDIARDVFYIQTNQWKEDVVNRGLLVFTKSLNFLAKRS